MSIARSINRRTPYTQIGYAELELAIALGPTPFLLYTYLSLKTGPNEGAWPSYATIRKETGIASDETVRKAMLKLVEAKVLEVQQRHNAAGDLTSNLYIILDVAAGGFYDPRRTGPTETVEPRSTEIVKELDSSSEGDSSEGDSFIAASPQKRVDPIWDAFVSGLGVEPSNGERAKWNAGIKAAKQDGLDPEEIERRSRNYVKHYPEMNRSPQAVLRNWTHCAKAPKGNTNSVSDFSGWRALAAERAGDISEEV